MSQKSTKTRSFWLLNWVVLASIYWNVFRPANSTFYIQNAGVDNSSVHWLFRINYMYYRWLRRFVFWYLEIFMPPSSTLISISASLTFRWSLTHFTIDFSLIGAVLVALIGYPISVMTGGTKNLDPKLLSPLFRRFYKANLEKSHIEMTFITNPDEVEKLKEKIHD